MSQSGPRPAFYGAVAFVVIALAALAFWRFSDPGGQAAGTFSDEEMARLQQIEAPDAQGPTTVKEYNFVTASQLPEVKGVSNYEPLQDNTVRMALNVWAGWAPLVHANGGFKAGKVWTAPNGQTFKVELVLIDDPVAMRDAYAAGSVHTGWATVDMIPLMMDGLARDSRTMPRIYQQIDFSNGGDGIVCRGDIRTVADLRGKTWVLAQNSPSHFFALNTLLSGGLQPGDVTWKFTADAFQAAAAFNADRSISCAVTWAPDIYNLSEVQGNRMLVTTQTANKLIADVWFARADFAKDHAPILEGIVRGVFTSMEQLKDQAEQQKVAQWMSDGYSIPASEALGMLGDAHWTNYAENRDFFLNANNPAGFERLWNNAYFLYRKIGVATNKIEFDQVVDPSILKKLEREPAFANQRNEYVAQFAPTTAGTIQAESEEILTKTVTIAFPPNSWDLLATITKTVNGKPTEQRYDPNADFVVDEIGALAGQYGFARIVIEGHTDASMRGQVAPALVRELALHRANAVKEAVIRKFPSLDPNQFATAGMGWDRPADPRDPDNHAKNRRVEVKVYPAEKTN